MQSSGVHALVLGDQQSQDKGLLVKGQHYAWHLGTVFNLKTPLGLEGRLLLAVQYRMHWQWCAGRGRLFRGGQKWGRWGEEKKMGVGEVI